MRETLSSALTFFYKYIFTTVWIGVFGYDYLSLLLSDNPHLYSLPLFVIWILVSLFLLATVARCKKVELIGTKLVVSNYFNSKKYDLSDIISVHGSLFINPELVWFKVRTKFREKKTIVFMPKFRFTLNFTRHPIVKVLEMLKEDAEIEQERI